MADGKNGPSSTLVFTIKIPGFVKIMQRKEYFLIHHHIVYTKDTKDNDGNSLHLFVLTSVAIS